LRNAIFMQWLLLFEGLRTPLNKIYLVAFHWPYLGDQFYSKARFGAHVAIFIDLGTDVIMTMSAWTSLYLIRLGRFRHAVALYIGVVLCSGALAYTAFGYRATDGSLTMIMVLALGGMMLGRKALWITYAVEAVILAISVAPIGDGASIHFPAFISETYNHLPMRALMSYLLIAIILDRSIHALRDSLEESNHQRQLLSQEIVERERTHEQLLHAQKMDAIGKLTSGIAHDINNVFGIILGFSTERDRLIDSSGKGVTGDDAQAVESAMEGIELAARRGAAVCRKLLNFSRRDTTHEEIFDITSALRELHALMRQLLPPSIHLHLDLSSHPIPIRFDRSQFELAIINLVSNARDAMPDGGTCHISLREEASHAVLTVRDTGTGMLESTREKIFEPFFTTKPTGSGTGLGLSVVYNLVQRAGGHISVDSEFGRGSAFRIELPVATSSIAAPSHPTSGSVD
jgi:signal transduction histidine kinase